MLISSEIFDKLNSRFGARAFVFQQDGARPHTAKSTRKFLEANVLTLPEELNWPPMSPDLSVIENLWSVLKYRIDYTTVADGESLYREASRVWDEIPIDFVNNCLGDFECRLQACAALQGAIHGRGNAGIGRISGPKREFKTVPGDQQGLLYN